MKKRDTYPPSWRKYAAPICAAPDGLTYDECIAVWGVKKSYASKRLHRLRAVGLIDQTHRHSARNRWTSPERVASLRAEIDRATPPRVLKEIQRQREKYQAVDVEAEERAAVAWAETKPRHIVGQAWQTMQPPGPRSIFEVATCR
jgi:DNA-binding transcriptional regulator GbsR (MarR family)